MAQSEKRESSVLFSLRELRSIEETRVREEEDAAKAAEEARIRARMDEERRGREVEEAKIRAQEDAARRDREMADQRAREDAVRVQEAEARARAEQNAQLEAQRLQHEMELRRREVEKKRPTWLLITVGAAVVAAVVAVVLMVRSNTASDEADRRARASEAAKLEANVKREKAEAEQRELARQLTELNTTVEALNKEMADADNALAAASTKADRDRVAAQQAEIRRKQAEAQARINKVRAGVRLKCPPDQPLC